MFTTFQVVNKYLNKTINCYCDGVSTYALQWSIAISLEKT